MKRRVLAISMCVMALMGGCGGGGGTSDGASTSSLFMLASVSYPDALFADPWDTVRVEPNITGSVDKDLLTFEVSSLPPGFSLDPKTGAISGGFTPSNDPSGFGFITVKSSAHPGVLSTELRAYKSTIEYTPLSANLNVNFVNSQGDWVIDGSVGALLEVESNVTMSVMRRESNGELVNNIALPLPNDATIVYSLDASSTAGAVIDSNSGVIRWTPSIAGDFRIIAHADVAKNGTTFRSTMKLEVKV